MHPRQSLLLEIGGVTNRIRRRLRGAQRTSMYRNLVHCRLLMSAKLRRKLCDWFYPERARALTLRPWQLQSKKGWIRSLFDGGLWCFWGFLMFWHLMPRLKISSVRNLMRNHWACYKSGSICNLHKTFRLKGENRIWCTAKVVSMEETSPRHVTVHVTRSM